jgi:DNA-directed RNA polymerase subunit K/omega
MIFLKTTIVKHKLNFIILKEDKHMNTAMNINRAEQEAMGYEDLLDVIEAQNFLIAELQKDNDKLRKERENVLSVPPVIENGVVVQLGRSFY